MPLAPVRNSWRLTLVCLAITALTCLIYWQVSGHLFLAYDDDIYITANPNIKDGLTVRGLIWAFSSIYESNWLPLTWLSHMLDVQLFGMNPGPHHLSNVVLHLLNSLLLFFLFRRLTASLWRPALLALLFAAHPLHVESVAWAAERKDLLCGLFYLLSLYSYSRYKQEGGRVDYLLAVLAFGLGLLAKPMIVTLPLVLMLLDHWPLARGKAQGWTPRRALLDKLPFLLGSAASGLITIVAQTAGGSLSPMARHPLSERLLNAAIAYQSYLAKIVLPIKLSVFYPYPTAVPLWRAAVAIALLAGLSWLAWRRFRTQPYLLVGWLWFITTLLPVIGIIQVGEQAMADRYAYLPIIGILLVLVWGGAEVWARCRAPLALAWATAGLALALLTMLAARQTSHWQNQYTLFQHSLAVTDNNYLACFQVGSALVGMERLEEARDYFQRSIAMQPTSKAYNNLAYAEEKMGLPEQAMAHYRQAMALDPNYAEAHYNLGLLLVRLWRLAEARREFDMTLRLAPNHLKARQNLSRTERMINSGEIRKE